MLTNKYEELFPNKDMFWILVDNKHQQPLVNSDNTVTHFARKNQVPIVNGYHPQRVSDVFLLCNNTWVTRI